MKKSREDVKVEVGEREGELVKVENLPPMKKSPTQLVEAGGATAREDSTRTPYTAREDSTRTPVTAREDSTRTPDTARKDSARTPVTAREDSTRTPDQSEVRLQY